MYANGIQISQITSWITLYRFASLIYFSLPELLTFEMKNVKLTKGDMRDQDGREDWETWMGGETWKIEMEDMGDQDGRQEWED